MWGRDAALPDRTNNLAAGRDIVERKAAGTKQRPRVSGPAHRR